eukprot:TRINITY_DN1591_c0_g1_i1.p2 TRINITY_DN1591_c0_g1~~TRINITY_DN1591_c0_g1_i1.p2  ORF type:complete len:107 (+),score=16.48 TRINITY_DN1591_c0_g1_i1:767-1087(+)
MELGMNTDTERLKVAEYRAAGMRAVEIEAVQTAQMYTRLSTMLVQQADDVARLEDNMDSSFKSVERGQQNLMEFFKNINTDRSLIVKCFGLLVMFIVIFFFLRDKY